MVCFRVHMNVWRWPCIERYTNGDWTAFFGPTSLTNY